MKTAEKIAIGAIALFLMYRLKHILDPKNVLMSDRTPTPDPQYPTDQTIFRPVEESFGHLSFIAYYTGDLTVTYDGNTYTFDSSQSGHMNIISGIPAGDVAIFTGAISQFVATQMGDYVSVGDTLTNVSLGSIRIIDLRNANNNLIGHVSTHVPTHTLYAKATSVSLKDLCLDILTESTVSDGILWINPNDTYAADVIAAAQAKGWSVYEL